MGGRDQRRGFQNFPPPGFQFDQTARRGEGGLAPAATAMINEARAIVRAPVHLAALAGVKRRGRRGGTRSRF